MATDTDFSIRAAIKFICLVQGFTGIGCFALAGLFAGQGHYAVAGLFAGIGIFSFVESTDRGQRG